MKSPSLCREPKPCRRWTRPPSRTSPRAGSISTPASRRPRQERRAIRVESARVGCCGFPVARRQYFAQLSLVEIQQSFYQPPAPETVSRWRDEAPPGFEFTLKAWQLITHEASSPTYRRLRIPLTEDERRQAGSFRPTSIVRRAWEVTLNTARGLYADKILFQCPASFTCTAENKDRMRRFFTTIERGDLTCIWEPRGDWPIEDISALCKELRLVHCAGPLAHGPATRGFRYYRLHGVGGRRRHHADEELSDLCQRAGTTPAYFLFNNISMFADARRFRRILSHHEVHNHRLS